MQKKTKKLFTLGCRLQNACVNFSKENALYATEAAEAVLKAGFDQFNLQEIVAFTVPANKRSMRVMTKIGMKRDLSGDFDDPRVPDGHPLKGHVLYRITKKEYDQLSFSDKLHPNLENSKCSPPNEGSLHVK